MKRGGLSILALGLLAAVSAHGAQQFNFAGNLGYNYRSWELLKGTSASEDSQYLGNVNASGWIGQPWLLTVRAGAALSITTQTSVAGTRESRPLSTHLGLDFLPRSRTPFYLRYADTHRVTQWVDTNAPSILDLDSRYRARFLSLRQRLITGGGNQLDGWFQQWVRGVGDDGELRDQALGLSLKSRSPGQNLYANVRYQQSERSALAGDSRNLLFNLNHRYTPTPEFYVNTLVDGRRVDNGMDTGFGSYRADSRSDIGQLVSTFYWRPTYKPYNVTGSARLQRRAVSFATTESNQLHFNAAIAGTYHVNRRMRLMASADMSSLDTDATNSVGSRQTLAAYYQSERQLLGEFQYYWYGNATASNEILAQFETVDTSQRVDLSLGHNAQRTWKTGNRSTFRLSLLQSLRQGVGLNGARSSTYLNHTGTLTWSGREGPAHWRTQLLLMDRREVNDGDATQLGSLQITRRQSIGRLSRWGVHLSVQSSRRTGERRDDAFLTTAGGRLDYEHQRLLGIYRLKFYTKVDGASIANRNGQDRRQVEWESRLSYRIGLLNTAVMYRIVANETSNGARLLFLRINRSF